MSTVPSAARPLSTLIPDHRLLGQLAEARWVPILGGQPGSWTHWHGDPYDASVAAPYLSGVRIYVGDDADVALLLELTDAVEAAHPHAEDVRAVLGDTGRQVFGARSVEGLNRPRVDPPRPAPRVLYGHLHDYDTGEALRPATAEEADSSREAATRDGGAGVIEVDGTRCYVVD